MYILRRVLKGNLNLIAHITFGVTNRHLNTFLLQIIIDFEELQQRLRDGTSELCCFDNHNVMVENAVFQNSQNAASVAGQLFVRITT